MFFISKTHAPPEKAVFIRPSKNTPEETLRKLVISVRKQGSRVRNQGTGIRGQDSEPGT
jgi:hypothetical protein